MSKNNNNLNIINYSYILINNCSTLNLINLTSVISMTASFVQYLYFNFSTILNQDGLQRTGYDHIITKYIIEFRG